MSDDAQSPSVVLGLEWEVALAERNHLDAAIVKMILESHGGRGRKAIEGVGESRVKEYRDFTIVVGHNDEYIVEDYGCTCKDAQYNLDREDQSSACWHTLAVILAEHLDAVESHDMWYSDVRSFL